MTNWIDRILDSNAGRSNPERAKELIEKAGGKVTAAKGIFPTRSSPSAISPAAEEDDACFS